MTHASLLKQLLPNSYDANGRVLNAQLQAEGNALDGVVALADSILNEADPRSALLQIPAWESVFGSSSRSNIAARRAYLLGKMNETGGQDKQYFIALAKSLGFIVTIDEFVPATVMGDVMTTLFTPEWRFVWRVNALLNGNYQQATIMDTVMDAFAAWGNADFEAALRDDAPAHTKVLFAYN